MWENVMLVNSVIIWPLSIVFLIYAAGRGVIMLDWKTFVIAVVVFAIASVVQIAVGIINE